MKKQTFILKNHHKKQKEIEVEASLEINEKKITVEYKICGELKNYHIERISKKQRANELWKATCLELFISPKRDLNYWELNISPSKKWNVYAFDSYKKNMREEMRISSPILKIDSKERYYFISCEFNLQIENLHLEQSRFNLAVILLDTHGMRHFYTINKKESVVDFHDKKYWKPFLL